MDTFRQSKYLIFKINTFLRIMITVIFTFILFCGTGFAQDPPEASTGTGRCSGDNEVWGIKCEDSFCENPYPSQSCTNPTPNCYCRRGYARDYQGKCVPIKRCRTVNKCPGENEIRSTQCGESYCERPDAPDACIHQTTGCFCKPGYSRDYEGKCVLYRHCPPTPTCNKEGQEWQRCHGGCDKTCENPDFSACYGCINGCFCKPGYVLHEEKCIPKEQCPPKCGENEMYYTCHGGCEATCKNPNPGCKACAKGCYCKPGFVRENTKCIPEEDCYPKCYGQNEKYYKEHDICDGTCQNPNLVCGGKVSGCFCKENYVRNRYHKCIEFANCRDDYDYRPKTYVPCPGNYEIRSRDGTCDCMKGYVRNDYGECALPGDVPDQPLF